ncbi:MAG: YdcF family protein [Clostridia bacterium]
MKMAFRLFLILVGMLLILDTIFVSSLSNGHLGTVLPAIVGTPLLIIGLFYTPLCAWFASGGFGSFVKYALIVLYCAFTLFILVLSLVIYNAGNDKPQRADALIVLGCGVRGSRVSLTLKNRLDMALEYMDEFPETLVVVSGGQGPGEDLPEGTAMQRYLVAHGADPARILIEDASSSTYENFTFSMALIDEACCKDASVAFITTQFHVFRSRAVARSLGIDAHGYGAPGVWYVTPNDYLRECVAVTIYFLRGSI